MGNEPPRQGISEQRDVDEIAKLVRISAYAPVFRTLEMAAADVTAMAKLDRAQPGGRNAALNHAALGR